MRHIEFLGVPGSGKSALAAAVVEGLGDPGVVDLDRAVLAAVRGRGHDPLARSIARISRSPSSRLWKRAYTRSTDRFGALTRFLARHPRFLPAVLAAQEQRRDRDAGQEIVLSWILNLAARFQLATETAEVRSALVIDEGFSQRAVALFGHGFDPRDLQALDDYMDAAPRADLVVIVDTPADVCASRLDRGGWTERLTGRSPDERTEFLGGASRVVDETRRLLLRRDIETLQVDGTAPVEEAAARAISGIRRQLHAR